MSKVSFVNVLSAAARKDQAPALIADSVRDAAAAYARNGGAKNLLTAIVDACTTTSTGKARTPAAGTVAGLILCAVQAILRDGDKAGARAADVATLPPEEREKARDSAAYTYAEAQRAAFVASVEKATQARKDAKAAADAIKAAGTVAPAPVAVAEGEKNSVVVGGPALSDALAQLQAADEVQATLRAQLEASQAEANTLRAQLAEAREALAAALAVNEAAAAATDAAATARKGGKRKAQADAPAAASQEEPATV